MIGGMPTARAQQRHDHRLRELVQCTGNLTIATDRGVPRSTARGWLRTAPTVVVGLDVTNLNELELQHEVVKLRRRLQKLAALLRLALILLRVSGFTLSGERLPDGQDKQRILWAVDQARACIPLRALLRLLHLSPSRFHAWRRRYTGCALDDQSSCPRTSPHRLTPSEVRVIHDMVTATVRRLVAFYVDEHNRVFPHSAFQGQTPDEMYFGTGDTVPADLTSRAAAARQTRVEANRSASCETCRLADAAA
jgi:hypothetical protein